MDDDGSATTINRRGFIAGGTAAAAATALVVPLVLQTSANMAVTRTVIRPGLLSAPGTPLGAYLKIDSNDVVTVVIGPTEMGQGIMSGLAQLAAAELSVNWSQVQAEHSVTTAANVASYANPLFHAQVTGGSTSMRGWYAPMRQAAAQARVLLLQAAGKLYGGTWNLAPGGKVVKNGVYHTFGELVATAATLPLPGTQALIDPLKFIGRVVPRLDIPAKVNGSAVFGIDVVLPGMVYATTVHCPTLGGTVRTMPKTANGAKLVNLKTAVGVVAASTYAAFSAAQGLGSNVVWTLPANLALLDTTSIYAAGSALLTSASVAAQAAETVGDAAKALGTATKSIDATYTLPMLAHTYLEVINCTVNPTYIAGVLKSVELWVPTQAQAFVLPTVAALTGLPITAITVHTPYIGSGFGRKIEQDYVAEAVLIALAVAGPVKLTWSRPQDFTNDKYRPGAQIRVRLGADAGGNPTALIYRNVSPSISGQRNPNNPEDTGAVAGAIGLPYDIANRHIEFVPNPCAIPLGYWRSVGESYNTFAVESAIDEMALALKVDPLTFRRTHLAGDVRALGVVNAVATLANWGHPAAGNAQGLAFLKGFGSYIAVIAEVGRSGAALRVNKLSVAIDCGVVVNPDSVAAQLEGGLIHGMAATLWQQATFAKGVPTASNFNRYRVARLSDVPAIATTIVSSTADPGGVGETGVPCVAPAIANAWSRLTGARQRSLPFFPGSTMSDG